MMSAATSRCDQSTAAEAGNDRNYDQINPEIDTAPITPSTKRVRLRKQMLYVLRDVRGHTIEKTVPFETLFQSKSDALWDHMQEEARKGGPRPAWKTRENEALHNYRSQQAEKYKILIDINPKWAEIRGEKSQRELLRMAEAGQPKPKQGTPLGNALNSYRQRNPEFYARLIEICPDWGIGRDDSFAQQFERSRSGGAERGYATGTRFIRGTLPEQSYAYAPREVSSTPRRGAQLAG